MADEGMWKNFTGHEKDLSVLHVRYNTGLHISQNGLALAQLLEELQKHFHPKTLYLAGHSMGGLVIRSACYYGTEKRHSWVSKVGVIFLIAVPNAGAPLEKFSHVTSLVLRKIAKWYLGEIGDILEQRSNGIKDLRHGSMLEEDWNPKLSKAGKGERTPVPPIHGIAYHILVGTLLSDENSLLAKYFGDGLVTQHSAVGVTLMKTATVQTFPNTGHNSILNNPDVHRYVYQVLKNHR